MNNEDKILSLLENMQGTIGKIQGTIETMQGTIGKMQGDIETMQGTIGTMQGTIGTMQGNIETMQGTIGKIQEAQEETNRRLDRVEARLDEQGKEIAELKKDVSQLTDRVVKIEIFQENTLQTRLDILYEGQVTLNEQMGRFSDAAESVERMREIVPIMESTIRTHTRQLAEHEKLLAAS